MIRLKHSALACAFVLAATAWPSCASAQPAGFHDLVEIDAAVARFAGAGIGQPGGATLPVDRRLRLAPCRAPLALSWHGSRQDNVLVQCPDAGGWRLFVAVSGSARPEETAPAAIARGDAVTIAVEGDGFSVTQAGEALESGAQGAWIRVRSGARATPIRARIARPGLVVVPIQ